MPIRSSSLFSRLRWLVAPVLAALTGVAPAQSAGPSSGYSHGNGKLLLTAGVSSIDGAAGGGLTPWATLGTYATEGEFGASGFLTHVKTRDYRLDVIGVAVGIGDRVELSLARQVFDADAAVAGATLRLDIAGVKLRLAGDAVLDADRWMPQLALGAEFKRVGPGNDVGGVLDAVGAHRGGVDYYLSATKLFLRHGLLVNATLRATKANQNGLLGFGAADRREYRFEPEMSVAWLLRKDLALGAEYRAKPDNLAFAGAAFREHAWRDLFIAWAPNKHLSGTFAWVELGNIVGHERQSGLYGSLQLAY